MCFLLCLPSGLLFVTSVFNQRLEKSADGITVPGGRETNWAFWWQRCPSLLLFLLLFLRLSTQTIDSHSAFISPHRSIQLMESSSDVPLSFILTLSRLHRRSPECPGGKCGTPLPRPSADQIKPESLHLIKS